MRGVAAVEVGGAALARLAEQSAGGSKGSAPIGCRGGPPRLRLPPPLSPLSTSGERFAFAAAVDAGASRCPSRQPGRYLSVLPCWQLFTSIQDLIHPARSPRWTPAERWASNYVRLGRVSRFLLNSKLIRASASVIGVILVFAHGEAGFFSLIKRAC